MEPEYDSKGNLILRNRWKFNMSESVKNTYSQQNEDGLNGKTATLNRRCFKIDKTNAMVMIEGFNKDGKHIHQSIYCDVTEKPFPMLITLNRSPTRFIRSNLGDSLHPESFSMEYKYIAFLEEQYFIENNINLWNELCSNGLFDVWNPCSPKQRFDEAGSHSSTYRILLLRVYEINDVFERNEIRYSSSRIDHIKREGLRVTLKRPIIDDEEFKRIKTLLESSIEKYIQSPQNHRRSYLKTDNASVSTNNEQPYESYNRPTTLAERNFENIIVERLHDIEEGLTLIKRQYDVSPVGRIDLLCKDKESNLVVIELKKYGAPTYSIIDQIARYIGFVKEKIADKNQKVRGILIVGEKDEKLIYAAKAIPNLDVKTFRFSIE